MQATGTLQISASQAGYYTFGVNSDDGFSLTITGANFSNGAGYTTCSGSTLEYDDSRGAADTLGTTYLAAGSYPLSLVYFQGGGGDSIEFYAAKESSAAGVTSFDANSILVGATTATTASGGISATTTPLVVTSAPFTGTASNSGAFAAAVATNVKPAIESAIATAGATSLYTRITFSAANYASLSSLTLKMQYDDGYVAYLNGVEIASENAPSSPDVELVGQRGADQRRAGHDLRGRRPFQFPQFGHDRPPHGHRQRAGDPGPDVLGHGRRHAGRAGTGPDDERRRGRPHFLHAHAGRRQRAGRRRSRTSPSARRTGSSTAPSR